MVLRSSLSASPTLALVVGVNWVALAAAQPAPASQPVPAKSDKAVQPPAAPASVSELAFLAGVWHARSETGGYLEEHVSAPASGMMMGMFRLIDANGKTPVVEMETFCDVEGSIDFRFRHFSTRLEAWEAPKDPVTLRLAEKSATRWVWVDAAPELNRKTTPARMTWEFPEPDRWRVMVDVRRPEGEQRMIDVVYRRVSAGAPAANAVAAGDTSAK